MKPIILIIDDQSEVLAALSRDLEYLLDCFDIWEGESGEEAMELILKAETSGAALALLITDHVMPGLTGVDLLEKIRGIPYAKNCRRVMLTGQANQNDTIEAINRGRIDHYLEKPWNPEELKRVVSKQLTEFICSQKIDYRPFINHLDGKVLANYLRESP